MCPVREACLEYALAIREPHGVWGGCNEMERRALLRQRARSAEGPAGGAGRTAAVSRGRMRAMSESEILQRLSDLGLELPPAPEPVASYVPVVEAGGLAFVAGQIPMVDGQQL